MPMVRRNEPMSTWEDGDFVQGFALVNRKEQRLDRKGREYLDLELADAASVINAKIWPDALEQGGEFGDKDFVFFKGTVRAFRDQLQLTVDHCRRARDGEEDFDEALLVPSAPEPIEELWQRLAAIYPAAVGRAPLKRLAEEALRRHGEDLRVHPAAKSIHHAYRGGLLEHVVTMAELTLRVCAQYADLDRDLMLLGVLFHDLGKIVEIGAMPRNDYTLRGQLVGHVVIGHGMLGECCAAIDGFPEDLHLHLAHLVLSHQGRGEYGSPKEPVTPEAVALHAIDDLDAKLNQLRTARRRDGGGLQFLKGFGRTVYLDTPP